MKAEYKKKLEDTKKALDEQVKTAITEFQNVQPTNEKMTDLQDTKYVVYESVENNESMMDTFVKHPIKTGMLNGKNIWSWKLLMTITGKISWLKVNVLEQLAKMLKITLERLFSHMLKVKPYMMLSLKFT